MIISFLFPSHTQPVLVDKAFWSGFFQNIGADEQCEGAAEILQLTSGCPVTPEAPFVHLTSAFMMQQTKAEEESISKSTPVLKKTRTQ